MTNTTQPSQADREAAAACIAQGVSHVTVAHILSGEKDDWFFVQAFTRYRLDTEKRVRESLAGEANVERVAKRVEAAPLRIYSKPEEAWAYLLGRQDAIAIIRAKKIENVDDYLATLERTTDAG